MSDTLPRLRGWVNPIWERPRRGGVGFGLEVCPRDRNERYCWPAVLLGVSGVVQWPLDRVTINGQWYIGLRWPLTLRIWSNYSEWKKLV